MTNLQWIITCLVGGFLIGLALKQWHKRDLRQYTKRRYHPEDGARQVYSKKTEKWHYVSGGEVPDDLLWGGLELEDDEGIEAYIDKLKEDYPSALVDEHIKDDFVNLSTTSDDLSTKNISYGESASNDDSSSSGDSSSSSDND